MNEEDLLKRKILDTANQAFNHNIYTYTNFLSISELSVVNSFKKDLSFIDHDIYGAVRYAKGSLSVLVLQTYMAMMLAIR